MKIHSVLTGFLAIVCVAIAIYSGNKMAELRFWGHLPLFLLMGGWLAIVLIIKSLQSPNTQSIYYLSLAILSGIFLAKAFVYLSPLLFLGFIPLLILQDRLESENPKTSWWVHSWYVYIAFMVWNIGATYWVANAALIPAIVAFVLNSFFMSIPWIGFIWFGRRYPKLKYISLIAFWLSFEWVHQNWEISWPWLTLGNGLAFVPQWIQWYDITGTFGGSLWILLINILLFLMIRNKDYSFPKTSEIVGILLIPILFSYYRYHTISLEGSKREVGIVQPNYEPHFEKFEIAQTLQMSKFLKLSHSIIDSNMRYLIWPETSFEAIQTDMFDRDWRIDSMRSLIKDYPGLNLITGLTTVRAFRDGEPLTNAARPNRSGGYPRFYEIQNSAIQISNSPSEIPVYVKSKLVPGVETFPYRQLLPFLKPVVDKLNGSVYGLGKQKKRTVFQYGLDKIAPVICYESIYGNYVGEYIRNGAQAIFIMTNDGWWDDTPGYKQHLAFGALRAIEHRRWIARSANTGTSCFINPRGDIENATPYGNEAVIKKEIVFSGNLTVYAIIGDLIAYCGIYLGIALLFMCLFKFLKVRFSKSQ